MNARIAPSVSPARTLAAALAALAVAGCASSSPASPGGASPPAAAKAAPSFSPQPAGALIADTVVAVAYSPYRAGQHPDRGAGANEPSDAEILEDLQLLVRDNNFPLLRLYDAGAGSARILALIQDNALPVRVLLGAWLSAEVSTHETCEWLTEPIPDEELAENTRKNALELDRVIALANRFAEIVVAVNVGNEVLVDWNDHRVSLAALLSYIERVKAAVAQPVTVADNYVPWSKHRALGEAADFAAVHTYPIWEGKGIDEGLAFTVANLHDVQVAQPGLPIAIGEAGWATVASEFPERASQEKQTRYFQELTAWARAHNVTTFFFEAFDERWKGNPADPLGAEKHWGLFDEERRPKQAIRSWYPDLTPAPR